MIKNDLPNIVLIVMDSVSAKYCSVYSHERDTTPGLRQIASEGVLYRHCYAPATWTVPSHASLFTGLYPWQHCCGRNYNMQLPDYFFSLSHILKNIGYTSIGISCNSLISPQFSFNRGFNYFYLMNLLFNLDKYNTAISIINKYNSYNKNDIRRFLFLINYCRKNKYFMFLLHKLLNAIYSSYWGDIINYSYFSTERAVKYAKKTIQKYKTSPFFLFINFMEAHYNYYPPANFNNFIKISNKIIKEVSKISWKDILTKDVAEEYKEIMKLLYEQEIYYLDNRILDVFNFIKKIQLKDNTLFIVTSDHGECFGEHGSWGHTFTVYNELIKVPLIIIYPEPYKIIGESDRLVNLQDIFATIMDIVQSPFPIPDSSISLLSGWRNYAFAELFDTSNFILALKRNNPNLKRQAFMQPCWCVIDSKFDKLIIWSDGRRELYNLENDNNESINLINNYQYSNKAYELNNILLNSIPMNLSGVY